MYGNTEISEPDDRWYVVHCIARKEAHAASMLKETLGLGVFLPEVSRAVRGTSTCSALFPGYLFIQMDDKEIGPTSVNSTPGVVKLLEFGGGPVSVDGGVVEGIRERLAELNGGRRPLAHGFHKGDTVRLKSGPLRGLDAVFVGPMEPGARVRVLLDFLGRQTEMKVAASTLERVASRQAAEEAPDRRERRTRGRGRKIEKRET